MKKREMKIDQILKDLTHVPHSSRSETTSPQTKMHVGSGVSISTELSDEEMREEMGSGLIQDDLLTKEELRIATIEGAIPTMIADSGASTTCMQPEEEQGQKSECGRYKWDTPFEKNRQGFRQDISDGPRRYSARRGHRSPERVAAANRSGNRTHGQWTHE